MISLFQKILLPFAYLTTGILLNAQDTYLDYPADPNRDLNKRIVLLAGDEEYRSEEALPMLAQLLSRQGFHCTVHFSLADDGTVSPTSGQSLSNPSALADADLIITSLRFRNWDNPTMEQFDAAMQRGTAIIGLRTSTHAFRFPAENPWHHYSFNHSSGGFGERVLGDTWHSHHGRHKRQGCRAIIESENQNHPALTAIPDQEIFVESDVYEAHPPEDAIILLRGQVTRNLQPDSAPVASKNNPMQAIAWSRELPLESASTEDNSQPQRIITTTMGAASDLDDAGLRRFVINAAYWCLGLEVPQEINTDIEGTYEPTFYGFDQHQTGKEPEYFRLNPINRDEVQHSHDPSTLSASNKQAQKSSTRDITRPQVAAQPLLQLPPNSRIAIVGNTPALRLNEYGFLETQLHFHNSNKQFTLRNFSQSGHTPLFRPHPSRNDDQQTLYQGADELIRAELRRSTDSDTEVTAPTSIGHFPSANNWLEDFQPNILLAFWGQSSAFYGTNDLDRYRQELAAYIDFTRNQSYHPEYEQQLVIIGPPALEDLSAKRPDLRVIYDLSKQNQAIEAIDAVMQQVCEQKSVSYISLNNASKRWYESTDSELTVDGLQLNEQGNRHLAAHILRVLQNKTTQLNPNQRPNNHIHFEELLTHVQEKNWMFDRHFRVQNGVHVYGRRHAPYGTRNYPDEIQKSKELTANRDAAIHAYLQNLDFDLEAADSTTTQLEQLNPGRKPKSSDDQENNVYLEPQDAVDQLQTPEGYDVNLFASEQQFSNLANPVQLTFDNSGRLWVAVMPSYPHYRPGDPKPDDKILIYEDTNNDGVADKETVYADGLHIITGFDLSAEGVIVCSAGKLILFRDNNGDSVADHKEYLQLGFDTHDSHHSLSAFFTDPTGGILGGQGVFLKTHLDTAYGPVRGTDGNFFRYVPHQRRTVQYAQTSMPNPWGISANKFGSIFYLFTSSSTLAWMDPATNAIGYGISRPHQPDLLSSNKVRPTSGLETLSSRHFPDEMQGDLLLGNNIGYLGIKQHALESTSAGYQATFRQNLLSSSNNFFRPVDLEIAPDGSLYMVDWSNELIGHMQHNARDPRRDKQHGRIYRLYMTDRELITPPEIAGASIAELIENLRLPEQRARSRSRLELRKLSQTEVVSALNQRLSSLNMENPADTHHALEIHWVLCAFHRPNETLTNELLAHRNPLIVSAAIRTIQNNPSIFEDRLRLLQPIVERDQQHIRISLLTATSRLPNQEASELYSLIDANPLPNPGKWLAQTQRFVGDFIYNQATVLAEEVIEIPDHLDDQFHESYRVGAEVYVRDVHCGTCHQADGQGLPNIYPPLANSEWVTGSSERLIKIILHGLHGPIEVNGQEFGDYTPPMMAFESMLDDQEVAAVATYVRNNWGNQAEPITADEVSNVRAETTDQIGTFYTPSELLSQHPRSTD